MYIDNLDDTVNKYNNTYHSTIKMKPVDAKWNTYINYSQDINDKDPKFKIGDIIRALKYKTRTSCLEVFCKKGVYRNFTKFTGKHLCQSLFFNKELQTSAINFVKKETLPQMFSCEFCEISNKSFFTEHLWWLLLRTSLPQAMFQIGLKKFLWLKRFKSTVPWTLVIMLLVILTEKKYLEGFTKNNCKKQIKKSLELKSN